MFIAKNLPIPVLAVLRVTIGVGSRNPTEKRISNRNQNGPVIETVITKRQVIFSLVESESGQFHPRFKNDFDIDIARTKKKYTKQNGVSYLPGRY